MHIRTLVDRLLVPSHSPHPCARVRQPSVCSVGVDSHQPVQIQSRICHPSSPLTHLTPTPLLWLSLPTAGRAAGYIQRMHESGDITPANHHTVLFGDSGASVLTTADDSSCSVTGEPSLKSVAGERTLRRPPVGSSTRRKSASGGSFARLAKGVRNWAGLRMWIANAEVDKGGIGDTRPPAPRASQASQKATPAPQSREGIEV